MSLVIHQVLTIKFPCGHTGHIENLESSLANILIVERFHLVGLSKCPHCNKLYQTESAITLKEVEVTAMYKEDI